MNAPSKLLGDDEFEFEFELDEDEFEDLVAAIIAFSIGWYRAIA
jgi:hypothetical protein